MVLMLKLRTRVPKIPSKAAHTPPRGRALSCTLLYSAKEQKRRSEPKSGTKSGPDQNPDQQIGPADVPKRRNFPPTPL